MTIKCKQKVEGQRQKETLTGKHLTLQRPLCQSLEQWTTRKPVGQSSIAIQDNEFTRQNRLQVFFTLLLPPSSSRPFLLLLLPGRRTVSPQSAALGYTARITFKYLLLWVACVVYLSICYLFHVRHRHGNSANTLQQILLLHLQELACNWETEKLCLKIPQFLLQQGHVGEEKIN